MIWTKEVAFLLYIVITMRLFNTPDIMIGLVIE